ncbi:ABC transporter ATP-binding protein/permease [Devriesea agamarum]|uniref:ABC transporter ATP-binding protein/permease n=1 Tax=Devriesea agamarum TaxID=472569 RepID=UPI00071CA9E4|nr:ATP-binding cassette domain-containing protein [Devriesea agamarum]
MMIVRELWREAMRFPAALSASVFFLLLVFGTYIAQAIGTAWAMSAVIGRHTDQIWAALLLIAGVALLRLVLSVAQTASANRLGGQVRQTLRVRSLTRTLRAQRLHDTAARDGSLSATLGDGIDGTDAYVSKYIPVITQVFIACPVIVVVLFILQPWAGAAVCLGVILSLLGPLIWKRLMSRRGMDHWDSYEALSADLLESLRGMATLRILGDVPGTRQRLHFRSEGLRRATERVMRVSLAETGITDFAVQAGVVAAAGAAIFHAVTGQAPAMEVYLILLLSSEAFRPIRELSRHWHAGFLGLTAIPGLRQLGAFSSSNAADGLSHPDSGHALETGHVPNTGHAPRPRDVPGPGDATGTGAEPGPHEGPDTGDGPRTGDGPGTGKVLRLTDLWFQYPDATEPVLHGINFTARRGGLSAVVGPSGAGKSTLFDLLLGFLAPDSGTITLDGHSLRRPDIAVVSQRPVLFADTIRANLCLGTARSDVDLAAACRAAGIWHDIEALPDGLDTEVTEAGSSLSGGQRQRLALARALLADRPVLLVDEPTSALDPARAHDIISTLHQVAAERIVIMITHRPESLVGISQILSLNAQHLSREPR